MREGGAIGAGSNAWTAPHLFRGLVVGGGVGGIDGVLPKGGKAAVTYTTGAKRDAHCHRLAGCAWRVGFWAVTGLTATLRAGYVFAGGDLAVIHVLDTLSPAYGGPPAVAAGLARAQAQLGLNVRMIFNLESESLPHLRKVYGLSDSNVELLGLSRSGRPRGIPGKGFWRLLVSVAGQGDIFHLHGVWEPTILVAAIFARSHGIPFVIAPHGMLDPWSLSQGRLKKRVALSLVYKGVLAHAKAMHVLTEREGTYLRNLGLSAPLRVLPNGISSESLAGVHPLTDDLVREYPFLDSPYVLFLGRLHRKKGLDLLIDAFALVAAHVDGARLVVVGPDDGVRPALEAQARALGLFERICFTGPIYGAERYSILAGAQVFCLTSRQEGFSVAILEALAAGVPVVISRECNFEEVGTVGAGKVVDLEPEAIAEAIKLYLSSEATRNEAGNVGRRLIAEKYTWEKIAERSVSAFSLERQFREGAL